MPKSPPIVYLLHGEDEFGISQFIKKLEGKLGDSATAEMNISHLTGNNLSLQELEATAGAMPFLTARRLIIVDNISRKLSSETQQQRLINLLERLLPTTALVLVESKTLPQKHWLLGWARSAGDRALVRNFHAPSGGELAARLKKHATDQGGEITPQAAAYLSELAGDDLFAAVQEVDKLLTYVNYQRAVDVDDVENLAAFATAQGDFFVMIDAIARADGRKALNMLHRLLEEQEPLPLFFRLVSDFRLLLLTREEIDNGGSESTVAEKLGLHPYRAKKLSAHARNLSMPTLEGIYQILFEYDQQIKTGQIQPDLALELFVANLTSQPA
ncbi:MAG: DNA polymerase III subunit delta [Chloroflexi bacterium]|nr:DNA polymerase III subunit delta [Chloroflexota bacterium]